MVSVFKCLDWLLLPVLLGTAVCVNAADNVCLSLKSLTDNGDGTVTDATTGLMWSRCPLTLTWSGSDCVSTGNGGYISWELALSGAESATTGGYTDWRLPNINELRSIVERNCNSFAINLSGLWLDTKDYATLFWSSTSYGSDPSSARGVDFQTGADSVITKGQYSALARPVRDAD